VRYRTGALARRRSTSALESGVIAIGVIGCWSCLPPLLCLLTTASPLLAAGGSWDDSLAMAPLFVLRSIGAQV